MSLILEALKKSEAARQRGKAPGLFVEQAVVAPRRRPGASAWVIGLGVLLVAVAVGAAWWGWSRGASMAKADNATNVPVPTIVPPLPLAAEGRGEGLDNAGPRPAPVTTAPPPGPAVAVTPTQASAPPPLPAAPAAAASAPAMPAALPVPPESPAPDAGDYLPRLADLPAAERSALPPLNITMHVFADEPAQRFVILDGRRHGEGATPTGGLVIREIRRDGLVISFNGRNVLVPRP